jgi:hypothetical protein
MIGDDSVIAELDYIEEKLRTSGFGCVATLGQ